MFPHMFLNPKEPHKDVENKYLKRFDLSNIECNFFHKNMKNTKSTNED